MGRNLKIKELTKIMALECRAVGKQYEFDTPFLSKVTVDSRIDGVVSILRMADLHRLDQFTIRGSGINLAAIRTGETYSVAMVINPINCESPFDLRDLDGLLKCAN